jgi:mono/diheme cytochrome c family protein
VKLEGAMRRFATGAIVIVLAAAALPGHARAERTEDADVAKGRELAHALCAQCHLNPGQGEKSGPMGVPGFVAVANRKKQTYGGIVRWLEAVPPMMPDHHLTQDEIYDLADFIMSLRKEKQEQ